ncbi:MAG: hypothetical protein WA624_02850, partial [Methylocella sp.]
MSCIPISIRGLLIGEAFNLPLVSYGGANLAGLKNLLYLEMEMWRAWHSRLPRTRDFATTHDMRTLG